MSRQRQAKAGVSGAQSFRRQQPVAAVGVGPLPGSQALRELGRCLMTQIEGGVH